jgi:hypothetical protein
MMKSFIVDFEYLLHLEAALERPFKSVSMVEHKNESFCSLYFHVKFDQFL